MGDLRTFRQLYIACCTITILGFAACAGAHGKVHARAMRQPHSSAMPDTSGRHHGEGEVEPHVDELMA